MTVNERVYEVVASMLRVPQSALTASSSPDTLAGWDSMRHLQIVLALEEAFGLQLTVEEIEAMHSVGVIAAIVQARVSETA